MLSKMRRVLLAVSVVFLLSSFICAPSSQAEEAFAVRTDGDGFIEECWLGKFVCKSYKVRVPSLVKVGDKFRLRSEKKDLGPALVESIFQESNGNCFLEVWTQKELDNPLMIGKCTVVRKFPKN